MDELRIRLVERLCRLPQTQLADVERLLMGLDGEFLNAAIPDTPTPAIQNKSGGIAPQSKIHWPHAPIHRLSEHGTYIVTASTLGKEHFFRSEEKLTLLESKLLLFAKQRQVILEAWAVFSNHYHFVAHATAGENQLPDLIRDLHYATAEEINRQDGSSGRHVWFNYWDTKLTFEKSYFARLNYVHQNAVKHGLVERASDYPWCSAAWFERIATRPQVKTIYSFRTDRVRIDDDYQPVM